MYLGLVLIWNLGLTVYLADDDWMAWLVLRWAEAGTVRLGD